MIKVITEKIRILMVKIASVLDVYICTHNCYCKLLY